ncbi:conserved hypothetical protein [Sphingomonas aurantiaca]|uniref:Helix-turn-helix domain-containing protein n=1 Tax=Sphingomonas aurantiaca TaxID=185949 RepID=A0A5E8ASX7_9SPHN|nr:conserved hypothetical protein [Sphingomonas aurantiaca]
MSLSPAEAGRHVGLTKQSIVKAIRSGRISAVKDAKGEWRIEPVELFRVWPAVNQDTGKVIPQVDVVTHPVGPPVDGEVVALLKAQLDDLRADRDHWRKAAEAERAERLALSEKLLLTDQRPLSEREPDPAATDAPAPPSGWWARLFRRSVE